MAESYKAILINEKNERFEKIFYSPIEYRKFINKAKKSKKLTLTSYDTIPY